MRTNVICRPLVLAFFNENVSEVIKKNSCLKRLKGCIIVLLFDVQSVDKIRFIHQIAIQQYNLFPNIFLTFLAVKYSH
jgi:hypothetical protein